MVLSPLFPFFLFFGLVCDAVKRSNVRNSSHSKLKSISQCPSLSVYRRFSFLCSICPCSCIFLNANVECMSGCNLIIRRYGNTVNEAGPVSSWLIFHLLVLVTPNKSRQRSQGPDAMPSTPLLNDAATGGSVLKLRVTHVKRSNLQFALEMTSRRKRIEK